MNDASGLWERLELELIIFCLKGLGRDDQVIAMDPVCRVPIDDLEND
jgi:hypothetical protein